MRLIDADALIHALETQDYSCAPDTLEDWTPQDMTRAEIADISCAPTVDAEPVVHGKWREVEVDKRIVYCCTVCHTVAHMPNPATFGLYDYCPHCGAKMGRR